MSQVTPCVTDVPAMGLRTVRFGYYLLVFCGVSDWVV